MAVTYVDRWERRTVKGKTFHKRVLWKRETRGGRVYWTRLSGAEAAKRKSGGAAGLV
jgi:hypothetical protein